MRGVQRGHRPLQFGQGGQGIAQAGEVAWARVAQADTGENALQVADLLELRLQRLEAITVEQAGDGLLACLEHRAITQRAVQPATEQAAGHGSLAAIHDRLQGVVAAAGEVDVQLQVTATGAVEDHRVIQALVAQAAQVRQGSALGFLGISQQAPGGADGQGQVLAAEAFQVLGAELLAQALEGAVTLEVPGRAATRALALLGGQTLRPVIRDQQFGGVEALQFGQQVLPALDFLHAEAAAGDVQYGQTKQAFITEYGSQQVVAVLVEQGFVADGTGGDDAHHLALHRALAGGRIADLFADHHRLAKLDQLGQVAFHRVEGNATHGDRLTSRLAAGRQGDVQQFCGFLRVFVENLVEVTHAIEHQLIWMLVLQLPVLLHHRGVS